MTNVLLLLTPGIACEHLRTSRSHVTVSP